MTLSFSNKKMGPLKALLALTIVLGHFFYYSDNPVFTPFHELAATAVAMFFFISGFGLVRSWQNKGEDYLHSFFKSRFSKILIPAIIFFIIHLLIIGNNGVSFLDRLKQLFMEGHAYPPQYWFIFVIIFDYILFWICYIFIPDSFRIPSLFIGTIVFMILTILAGYDRCWWVSCLAFPCGSAFASYEKKIYSLFNDYILRYIGSLLFLFLLAIGIYVTKNQYLWTLFYLVIPLLVALIVALVKPDKILFPILGIIGSFAYEIYLFHITAMEYLNNLFDSRVSEWVYVFAVLTITIAVSYVIQRLCSLLLNRK